MPPVSFLKGIDAIQPMQGLAVDGLLQQQGGGGGTGSAPPGAGLPPLPPLQQTSLPALPRIGTGIGAGGTYQPVELPAPSVQAVPSRSVPEALAFWAKTQARDVWEIFEGLPALAAKVAQGAGEVPWAIGEIYKHYTSSPDLSWRVTKDFMSDLWRDSTRHYRDESGEITPAGLWAGARDHSALALLDTLALASLGAGTAFKSAGVAKALGASRAARGLERAGKGLRGVEMAPYRLLARGMGRLEQSRLVSRFEQAFAVDPKSREYAFTRLNIQAKNTAEAKERLESVLAGSKRLSPAEMSKISDILNFRTPAIAGELSEAAKAALRGTSEFNQWWIKRTEELEAHTAGGTLPAGQNMATNAQIRKIALDAKAERLGINKFAAEHPKDWEALLGETPEGRAKLEEMYAEPSKIEKAAASEQRERMVRIAKAEGFDLAEHFYQPWNEAVAMDAETLIDDFASMVGAPSDLGARRRFGNMERAVARPLIEKDPAVWAARAARQRAEFLTEIEWTRQMLDREGRLIPRLQKVPDGWEEVPDLPYQKYLQDREEMARIAVAEYHRTQNTEEAMLAAAEAMVDRVPKELAETLSSLSEKRAIIPRGLARSLTISMQRHGFGAVFDKGLGLWKNLVFWTPAFFMHNLIGNTILTLLHGINPAGMMNRSLSRLPAAVKNVGIYGAEGSRFGSRWRGLWSKLDAGHNWLMSIQDVPFRHVVFDRELMKAVRERQFADRVIGLFGRERIDAMVADLGSIDRAVAQAAIDLSEEATTVGRRVRGLETVPIAEAAHKEGLAHGYVRKLEEAARLRQRLKGLEEVSARLDKVMSTMEEFFGGWGRATPWVRRYMRRVFPFWSFSSAMFRLAFKLPLVRPGTAVLWNRMTQIALEYFDEEGIPPVLRNAVLVGGDQNGRLVFLRVQGFNPFDSAGFRKVGRVPIPKLVDPLSSPLISVMVKTVGGYDGFEQPQPMDSGQFMDNWGRVWEWDAEKGEAVRASPQRPIWEALGELIPQVSWLNDLLAESGFQVPGRGPKVYNGPDGKPMNPRHWWWGFGRIAGVPVDTTDARRAKLWDRMQRARFMRMVVKRAFAERDPAARQQVLKVAMDVLHNEARVK